LACDTSLPATDLTGFDTLGSWSSLPALDASFLLVVMASPPSHHLDRPHTAIDQ
jgi:hypothetical protein